jgi:esterase/lipase superfamily enzyme
MNIEEHSWHSPHLEREMALKVYGHWGSPLLVFPCSRGRYYDYEGMGMIQALAPRIEGGTVKLFCVDSVDAQSWYDFNISPADRNARHEAYDRYILEEVVPFVRHHQRSSDARILTNGCSMGAYHAVNFFFRHPEVFHGVIALSGLYRLDRPEFGLTADDIPKVYFNSPLHYLRHLEDPAILDACRKGDIVVCVGQGAWEEEAVEDTRSLEALLLRKSIPAWVDFWGYDVNHDWPWWFRQMNHFLEHLSRR